MEFNNSSMSGDSIIITTTDNTDGCVWYYNCGTDYTPYDIIDYTRPSLWEQQYPYRLQYYDYYQPFPYGSSLTEKHFKELVEKINEENKKEKQPMKTAFEIYVFDLDGNVIMDRKVVIGEDSEEAKFEAGVDESLRTAKLKPKDVTILCNPIGDIKVRREPQEVKLIEEK